MTYFLLSFIAIGIAVTGMALGLLLGRGALHGSCGGLRRLSGLTDDCAGCRQPCDAPRNLRTPVEQPGSEPGRTRP